VPHVSVLAFRLCVLKNASENESRVYYPWKDYLKPESNRADKTNGGEEVLQEVTAQVNDVMGDDDQAAPAAAPTEGAAAADAARLATNEPEAR
jgi:predicted alpha/beta hydrolase